MDPKSPKTPLKFRKKKPLHLKKMMIFNYQNLFPLNKKPGTGRPQTPKEPHHPRDRQGNEVDRFFWLSAAERRHVADLGEKCTEDGENHGEKGAMMWAFGRNETGWLKLIRWYKMYNHVVIPIRGWNDHIE